MIISLGGKLALHMFSFCMTGTTRFYCSNKINECAISVWQGWGEEIFCKFSLQDKTEIHLCPQPFFNAYLYFFNIPVYIKLYNTLVNLFY